MKKTVMIAVALTIWAGWAAQLRRLPEVLVAEGESLVIDGQNAVGLQSANATVATITPPDGNKAMLGGVRLGHTEITYSDARGPFAVRPVMVVPSYWEMLKKFFEDDPEVTLGIVGDKVVVAGQTANVDTLRRLEEAKRLDTTRMVVQVTYSATALSVLVKNFLETAEIKGVDVKVVGREVCLSGRMYDKQSIEKADKRVREFLKDFHGVNVNSDGLRIYKQKIVIDIEFLSYNSNRARNLGIKPPKSVTGTFKSDYKFNNDRDNKHTRNSGGSGSSEYTSSRTKTENDNVGGWNPGKSSTDVKTDSTTRNGKSESSWKNDLTKTAKNTFSGEIGIKEFEVTINMLKENQVAKQLYATQLSTQSGEEAEFQSGGTHYKVFDAGQMSTSTKEIEHGFMIKTTPVILDRETVNLDFELDRSTPTSLPNSKDTDYDLVRYRTKSKYIIRPGESIILSGFKQMDDSLVKTGWPFLSKIPWIGEWLFGNHDNSHDDTDVLLVVTVNWAIEDEGVEARKRRDELRDRKVEIEMP